MSNVLVYLKPTCPYCKKAIALLNSKGVKPTVIDIAANPGKRDEMIAKSGRTTVPQIFIAGKHVGGCDDLHRLEKTGMLYELLGE